MCNEVIQKQTTEGREDRPRVGVLAGRPPSLTAERDLVLLREEVELFHSIAGEVFQGPIWEA